MMPGCDHQRITLEDLLQFMGGYQDSNPPRRLSVMLTQCSGPWAHTATPVYRCTRWNNADRSHLEPCRFVSANRAWVTDSGNKCHMRGRVSSRAPIKCIATKHRIHIVTRFLLRCIQLVCVVYDYSMTDTQQRRQLCNIEHKFPQRKYLIPPTHPSTVPGMDIPIVMLCRCGTFARNLGSCLPYQ